jgi:cytochrome d ubiquinol oxidase subunit I
MVLIGFGLVGLMAWAVWRWWRGRLAAERVGQGRWFWRAWVLAAPLGFIATLTGWAAREVGRQPWVIQGLMRTPDGVSTLTAGPAAATLALYTGLYVLLLGLFVVFCVRIVRGGPDLDSPLPARGPKGQEGRG